MRGNTCSLSCLGFVLLACGGTADRPGTAGTAGASGSAGNAGSSGNAGEAGTTTQDAGSEPLPDAGPPNVAVGPVDKLDLLLMLDNSRSMGDKQGILRVAVPDLVSRLTNPACVDASGTLFPPAAPGQACPAGQEREFTPIADIHIGVISSSLGDVGANLWCPGPGFPQYRPDRIDMAHLIGSLPRGQEAGLESAFLKWAPGRDAATFNAGVDQMVASVGQTGCGYESQLESWYRFLVDPFPYRSLVRVTCPGSTSTALNCVQQEVDVDNRIVLDTVLLQQRAEFLRPDSMLAVVMLTDENDCSVQVGAQSWVVLVADPGAPPMFRGSAVCAENPNDRCCYTCPLGPPVGCNADPICNADPTNDVLQNRLPADQDGMSLRCFDQKRRFGLDFLYPTQRYVNALREPVLCWNALDLASGGCAANDLVVNPLYSGGRPPERVFLTGILGVPWQAIASSVDAAGAALPDGQLRYQNARELVDNATWSAILGSPGVPWRAGGGGLAEQPGSPPVPPTLPQMVESPEPRPNVEAGNPINGREHDTRQYGGVAADDLQYSCIFRLPAPRDCAALDPAIDDCDCFAGMNDSPLCEETPGSSPTGTLQHWAKAYPSGRELEVLKGLGDNGILTSICARNLHDDTASDFGYRPAMAALLERLREQLP